MTWNELVERDPSVALLPLSRGMVALVDAADLDVLNRSTWSAYKSPTHSTWYASTGVYRDGRRTSTALHTAIMAPPTGMMVDHINHNGLDNRRSNLRVCTTAQNTQNSRKPRSGEFSRFKGVRPCGARADRWGSSIRLNDKQTWLGTFLSEEDAARAYDLAAVAAFGEFAATNVTLGLLPPPESGAPQRIAHAGTHCPAGHAYDIANTYITRSGSRSCRAKKRAGEILGEVAR